MIPEHADRALMKQVLAALHMNPERQDILLEHVFERYGIRGQALGRTGTEDHYHYASTFAFTVPRSVKPEDVEGILKQVAKAAFMWLRRWQFNPTADLDFYYGIVTFFGMMPFGDTRQKFYDDPPKLNSVERYVLQTAERLKRKAGVNHSDGVVGAGAGQVV